MITEKQIPMKQIFFFCLVFIFSLNTFSQISHGGEPYSFKNEGLKSIIDYRIMPEIDLEQLYIEDAIEENETDIPWRFGKDIAVDFNMNNSGTWENLPNGDRIWRLEIISYGAFSLNLIYNKFYMPEGGKLFLYNEKKNHIVGSFINENHKPDGGFATVPVKGEKCILEYYEPAEFAGQGQLEISYVIHAYKDFYANFEKGYGSSGSCNVNANCPEGDDWQDQKRGVAMILTYNNARICSGSMINNTAEDGSPYFLTANHCTNGSENTWIIMFNYESPACENEDGPTDQSVQYSTRKAINSASDFLLIELSEVPPLEYNVYYNGWNKLDEAAQESVCIHHPRGDIKKISFDDDPYTSDKYLGDQGYSNSHWKIEQWDLGTTEPGSSGSPLFNASQHIVGQLHGGWASCTNLAPDWYGKFSMSWDFGNQPSARLMDWLDPLGISPDSLNGFDPIANAYELNIVLADVLEPHENYGEPVEVAPVFVIRNMGNQIIESFHVSYKLNDGELFTQTWIGHIELYDTAQVSFDPIFLDYGSHELFSYVDSPNGGLDEFLLNDTLVKTIHVDFNYDIAIDNFISPQGVNCTIDTMKIKFIIKNEGFKPVAAVIATVQIDNETPVEYEISGLIGPGATSYIILDEIMPDDLWHHMVLNIEIDGEEDLNPQNNTVETDYSSFGNSLRLVLSTDDAAEETTWQLKNYAGEILETGGDYDNNTTLKHGFCLGVGCYVFTMYDSGGNGIQSEEGFSLINSSTGITLGGGNDFADSLAIDFCIGSTLSSEFDVVNDTTCNNRDVQFINQSTGADTYSWYFEEGTPNSSMDVSPVIQYKNTGVFDVSLRVWQGDETLENEKVEFITVLNCSGLEEIENNTFKIFPNPTKGIFTIQVHDDIKVETMKVFNQIGEEVYHQNMGSGFNNQIELKLENGMYIVEIKTAEGFSRQMLLITK